MAKSLSKKGFETTLISGPTSLQVENVINLIYVDGPIAGDIFSKIKILVDYILQVVLLFLKTYGKKLVIILIVINLTLELLEKLVEKIT